MIEELKLIVRVVCDYLRVNEDLFFCSRNARIIEAKRYVSYIAYVKRKIPPSKISSFLGVTEKRSSITIGRAESVENAINYDDSSQTALDINAIIKILDRF